MYSAQVLDHFQNPRNPGEVSDPDAIAEIENPACGDVLRLTLKIEAGRIAEIRFKAKGCVASIACASGLTELVRGRTVDEVRSQIGQSLISPSSILQSSISQRSNGESLIRQNLIAALGGLPQASTHAAQLALDALSTALSTLKP
jgi:NifU-like protein involved in Fe-S cluster formation